MSVKARLYKFLIDMDRITIEDVPEAHREEVGEMLAGEPED
jgi:hypothetical protein